MRLKSKPDNNAKVIIINGPLAVGKSMISKFLAKEYKNVALINGQQIKDFTVHRDQNRIETQLAYKAFALLSDMYIQAGYETIIIDYMFENDIRISKFLYHFKSSANVYFYTLFNDMDNVLNGIDFNTYKYTKQQVMESWETFYANIENFGAIIYNNRPLSDVVDSIDEMINYRLSKVEYKNKKLLFKDG